MGTYEEISVSSGPKTLSEEEARLVAENIKPMLEVVKMIRKLRSKKKHCPHSNLRGIYGDEINQHGFRLECMTCGRLLDGPVSLADKRRDEK